MQTLSTGSFGLSAICIVLLHFLKPELNIFSRNLSEYANGDYGVLMILAFILFAFGLLGLAFHSYRIISGDRLRVIFSFLFVVSAFACIIMGLFPATLQGTPSNTSSVIHMQTAPIFLVCVISAMSMFTYRLKFETTIPVSKGVIMTSGIFCLASFILLIIIYSNTDIQGLVQRIFAFFLWLWVFTVSVKLK